MTKNETSKILTSIKRITKYNCAIIEHEPEDSMTVRLYCTLLTPKQVASLAKSCKLDGITTDDDGNLVLQIDLRSAAQKKWENEVTEELNLQYQQIQEKRRKELLNRK